MTFNTKRRQQFLGEAYLKTKLTEFDDVIDSPEGLEANLRSKERQRGWHASLARGVGWEKFNRLQLHYTAGDDIAPLRQELEAIVSAYERYGQLMWRDTQDLNEPVFTFTYLDDYCTLMQLIGLCFLLHRRDLLTRIAALQDGENGSNGGTDVIYEEFMIHALGPEKRYATEHACQVRPYENLFYGLTEDKTDKQLKEIDLFLKHWYRDLAGTGWHDSHKPDEGGEQGGYYGYWSFEAGAAVLLLNIEDDSNLYKYLYYPKDLVAWARQHVALSATESNHIRLRALGGEPCPRTGFWTTPAAQSDSRQQFAVGDVMPIIDGSAWGATIWQWDNGQG